MNVDPSWKQFLEVQRLKVPASRLRSCAAKNSLRGRTILKRTFPSPGMRTLRVAFSVAKSLEAQTHSLLFTYVHVIEKASPSNLACGLAGRADQ